MQKMSGRQPKPIERTRTAWDSYLGGRGVNKPIETLQNKALKPAVTVMWRNKPVYNILADVYISY